MAFLLSLAFFLALPAGIAWATCAGLRVFAPRSSRRTRVAIAAGLAGLIPILIPLATILATSSIYDETAIAAVAILVGGMIIGIVIGLPVALLATRCDAAEEPPARTFE